MTIEETIKHIRELRDKATPGNWYYNAYNAVHAVKGTIDHSDICTVPAAHGDTAIGLHKADALLIVAEHQLMPTLLKELDRLLTFEMLHACLCGPCGEPMEGEWMDGSELTCRHCGQEVLATSMEGGGWSFPPVYDLDDPEEDEVSGE